MASSTSKPGSIHVSVRLHSVLRHRDGKIVDRLDLELPSGARIGDVLKILDVPDELGALVGLNDEVADEQASLCDGDTVSIIPAISGG